MGKCDEWRCWFYVSEYFKHKRGYWRVFETLGASSTYYIEVESADEMYDKVKDKVEIYKTIENTWYGAREFYIRDLNGYILGFSSMSRKDR